MGELGPGDRIGDYCVETVIGHGDMWDAYTATHLVLPRSATIRVPAYPAASVQLLREACIIEALAHPGVPRLYDSGRLADRRPWVATETLEGRVLADAIGAGPLPIVGIAGLLRDVAAILEHAHRRGVVHRAVRPETIRIAEAGGGWPVCLADWSEARAQDAVPAPRTTRPHDAPEVTRGDGFDGKVDVYALGVVALEALSGTRRPDGAAALTGVAELVTLHLGRRGAVTAAGVQLAWLLDDMLATAPDCRPTAGEVRAIATSIAVDLDRELADSADLALAMLAVEEISLADLDPIVIEDTRIAPVPPAPSVVLARLRKPRWTPAFGQISSDTVRHVAGEIHDRSRSRGKPR